MIGIKIYKPLQDNELPVYEDIPYKVEHEDGSVTVETRRELTHYEPNPAPNTLNKYSETAHWCNANDAHIEDRDDFYEVVANEHPEPTAEEKASRIRSERDQKLNATQWLVERHNEESERVMAKSAESTTLTDAEYRELLSYRQLLREVPQQKTFPESVIWPDEPAFLKC